MCHFAAAALAAQTMAMHALLLPQPAAHTPTLLLTFATTTSGGVGDFEAGETPMCDVTCAVVTHQFAAPCLSCCFQPCTSGVEWILFTQLVVEYVLAYVSWLL